MLATNAATTEPLKMYMHWADSKELSVAPLSDLHDNSTPLNLPQSFERARVWWSVAVRGCMR